MNETLIQTLIRRLQAIEPDIIALAILGPEILPTLREIVEHAEPRIAAGALAVAGAIGGSAATPVVKAGAAHAAPEVRAAAAAAGRGLPVGELDQDLAALFRDSDASVKKWAVRAAEHVGGAELLEHLQALQISEVSESIRSAIGGAVRAIERRR